MARGESSRSEPKSAAIGVWAVFGVITLATALALAMTTRACEGLRGGLPFGGLPPSAEPFAGAASAFGSLGWRDCVGGPDVEAELRASLLRRGYVRLAPGADAAVGPVELPADVRTGALGGACGVLVAIAERTSSLGPSRVDDAPPSRGCSTEVAAIGVCGEARVRLEGLGRARLEEWTLPGLTPGDAARTELPADALLALSEAEALLATRGWRPRAKAWRRAPPAGATARVDPGIAPSRGCVPWVTVAVGLGHAQSIFDSVPLASDASPDRALVAGAACAGTARPTFLRFDDEGRDGGTLVSLPFGVGAGPEVPGAARPASVVPSLEVVLDGAEVSLPPGVPGP